MYSLCFGSACSICISLFDILISLGLPCFSALHLIVLFSVSMSIHLQFHSSPILKPVSFNVCSAVAIFFVQPLISASASFSVGTNGIDGLCL